MSFFFFFPTYWPWSITWCWLLNKELIWHSLFEVCNQHTKDPSLVSCDSQPYKCCRIHLFFSSASCTYYQLPKLGHWIRQKWQWLTITEGNTHICSSSNNSLSPNRTCSTTPLPTNKEMHQLFLLPLFLTLFTHVAHVILAYLVTPLVFLPLPMPRGGGLKAVVHLYRLSETVAKRWDDIFSFLSDIYTWIASTAW